jgi:hypothetical protein
MTLADRILRSAFVAAAVGLGWGIRGDFGHLVGAMYPGACLAMGLAYVSRQRSLFLWMPILAAVSAIGIGSGGAMSYGILHGYAQADTFINYGYGFLTLFLQGAAWGTFGGAIIGLLLEREPMKSGQWLGLIGSVMAGGWITSLVVVTFLGFQINPPRNNSSITFFGAALAQLIWLACNRKQLGFRGGLLGYLGFGLGMAGGRLLGNLANTLQARGGFTINHWNVMEVSCGLIGGFIYCFGMVDRTYPPPPERENTKWTSALSIVYVLGLIPLWHRLSRIDAGKKIEEWSQQLQSYGYAQPHDLAEKVLAQLDGVCVLGFVGAAIWMLIHFRRWERLAWFPVLWLSLTMLLFQNVSALYFYYPHVDGRINMHNVFWVLFVVMALYVVMTSVVRPKAMADPSPPADDEFPVPWVRWIATSAVAFAAIVFLAGFVNGEATMRSANTRWPIWAWTQGPFPGNAVQEKSN